MRIELPNSWEGVTIKQFTELQMLASMSMDEDERLRNAIAILAGREKEDIDPVPWGELKKCEPIIAFIQDIESLKNVQIKEEEEINAVKYSLKLDISKITAGQYIDLKSACKDRDKAILNLHTILSIFYIPKGKKYNEVPAQEVAEMLYESMSIAAAFPVAVFFCNLSSSLNNVIEGYSRKKNLREMAKKVKTRDLKIIGVGI